MVTRSSTGKVPSPSDTRSGRCDKGRLREASVTAAAEVFSQAKGVFVPVQALQCKECRETYPLDARYVCERCFGPLEVAYRIDGLDIGLSGSRGEVGRVDPRASGASEAWLRKARHREAADRRLLGPREPFYLRRPVSCPSDIAVASRGVEGHGPVKPRQPSTASGSSRRRGKGAKSIGPRVRQM